MLHSSYQNIKNSCAKIFQAENDDMGVHILYSSIQLPFTSSTVYSRYTAVFRERLSYRSVKAYTVMP